MERSVLKELNKSTLEARINSKREALLKTMYWQKFFPLKYTTQLTWESLAGASGVPVMADVIEYNASAPLKTRRTVTKSSGDIPKIALKRKMDEKEMNEYQSLKALASDENRETLLDIVFGDPDFCYTGVMARTEYLAMQALSYGQISLTSSNNNGIITETNVDFGIPAGNKTAAAVAWSSSSLATPIVDITGVQDAANAEGYTFKYMLMDKTTLRYFLAAQEVKDQYAAFQSLTANKKFNPLLDDANAMLEKDNLPQIILIDSKVRFESNTHELSTLAPWKTGYVTFIPDYEIGNILHGPIAEEESESMKKSAVMVKKDHALITKWSQLEPFGEFTKGQANAFPRFTDVNGIFILKTTSTLWS